MLLARQPVKPPIATCHWHSPTWITSLRARWNWPPMRRSPLGPYSLGEYWMSSGAGLPINSKKAALDALSRITSGKREVA
jgi:hypothetical protein